MMLNGTMRGTLRAGGLFAGLAVAVALAGCGGGGGGGGGGSSSGGGGGGGGGGNTLLVQSAPIPAPSTASLSVGTVGTNGVELDILPGTSLSSGTNPFTVSIYQVPSPPAAVTASEPSGLTLKSPIYLVQTSGSSTAGAVTFTQPADLRLKYPAGQNDNQNAITNVFYYDPTSQSWRPLTSTSAPAGTAFATVQTQQTTYFALFEPNLPGNP